MQISIEVQKDLYEQVLSSGVDMQRKFNEYLRSQLDENSYMGSPQFQEDKAYFQKIHEEIKSGKVTLLSHEEVWDEIDKHLDSD